MRVADVRPLLDAVWTAKNVDRLLSQIARRTAGRLGEVCHAVSYDCDLGRARFHIRALASSGRSRQTASLFARTLETLPPDFVRAQLQTQAATHSTNASRADGVHAYMRATGAKDLLTINGWDARGCGLALLVHRARPTRLSPQLQRSFTRLGAHLVAARRLLERAVEPVAVLDAEGRPLEGRLGDAGHDVTAVARRLTQLRIAPTRGADQAFARVFPRIAGEWTLVGRYVEGGSDHVVLKRNPAPAAVEPRLTPREAQITGLIEAGHHMKLIAYELGISYATVRVLAARAKAKRSQG